MVGLPDKNFNPLDTMEVNLVAQFSSIQRKIAEFARMGLPEKAIASKLNVSRDIVRYHLGVLYAKMNVHSRAEFIAAMERIEKPKE